MPENPNFAFLFDGIVKHAHSSVEQAYNQVLDLDQEWEEALRNRNPGVPHIRKLIGYIGSLNAHVLDPKRRNEIFCYFCAASIYAKSMLNLSISKSELKHKQRDLTVLNEEAKTLLKIFWM